MSRSLVWGLSCIVWLALIEPIRANVAGYYTPSSGDFSLLVGSQAPNSVQGYVLISRPPQEFRAESFQPITDTRFIDRSPNQLGETRIEAMFPTGLHSLGKILPEGLGVDDFGSFFAARKYVPGFGMPQLRLELYYGAFGENPVYVEGLPDSTIGNPGSDPPALWANKVTFDYHPATGGAYVYGDGQFSAFQLFDAQSGFNLSELRTPAGVSGFSSGNIGYLAASEQPLSLLFLGFVLPKNLTLSDLQARFQFRYLAQPTVGVITPAQFANSADIPENWGTMALQVSHQVPEPSGLHLALVAVVALSGMRHPSRNRG